MVANIVNKRSVSVRWCLYVLSNTQATFAAQFIKKLSNTETELKKSFAYKKRACISKSLFQPDLKLAVETPVYKKKSKGSKHNYRPVSILTNISNIYERCLFN